MLSYYLAGGILIFLNHNITFDAVYNYRVLEGESIIYLALITGIIMLIFMFIAMKTGIKKLLDETSLTTLKGIGLILGVNIIFKLMYEVKSYQEILFLLYVGVNLIIIAMYIANQNLKYQTVLKEKQPKEKESIIKELSMYIETKNKYNSI